MASQPVLAASGLKVTRGGKEVLRGVDVEARAGEVVGVLGPSGAGKSTLFRALVGEAPPEQGAVLLDGRDVTRQPLWRRARAGIGYVPQEPSVLWDLSVRDNLQTFQRVAGGAGMDVRAAAARVGLEERMAVRAGELSGGERRRLELARALVRAPRVLICDEPFAGVDPAAAERRGHSPRRPPRLRGPAHLHARRVAARRSRRRRRAGLRVPRAPARARPVSR